MRALRDALQRPAGDGHRCAGALAGAGALIGALLLSFALSANEFPSTPSTPSVQPPVKRFPGPITREPDVSTPQVRRCPKLIGLSVEEAGKLIIGYELALGPITYRPSDGKPGTIIDQAAVPRPGQGNGTCAVVVAKAWTVVVPRLVGGTVDGARAELAKPLYHRLLSLGRQQRRESNQPPGTIVAQSPAPGTTVDVATPIRIAVAVPPPNVVVPNVTGMMQPAAEATLILPAYRGWLDLTAVGSRESRSPAGTIVAQDPAPGTRIGGPLPLRVWLARAPAVIVPDLSGLTPGAGVETLLTAPYRGLFRLRVLGERPAPNGHPAGTMFAQEPPPGTRVTSLTIINAWVAAAPPPVRVPNLSTLLPPAAVQRLGAAEFRGLLALGAARKRQSTARAGTIVDQRPPPQTPVTAPTKVDIWVAEAPPAAVVPNLVDFRPPDAKVHLASREFAGLFVLGDVRERDSDKPAGVIIDQKPVAGTKVTAKTAIDVWVAAVALAVVPDLANLTREGALAALTRAGLTLGDTRSERSERTGGSVIGQTPAAGQRVPRGTPVSIVLVAPPAFWKPHYLIAAALVVLLALATWTAWRRLLWPRLGRIAYRTQQGSAEITLDAVGPSGSAVRLRANPGPHETYAVVVGGDRGRRRPWQRTT